MEVEIDIDDVLRSCSKSEKRELYEALRKDTAVLTESEALMAQAEKTRLKREGIAQVLSTMWPHEIKRILCNALDVASYCDEQGLRTALERIIKA